jgi:nucleotide-binding universal stress UspA family protein
MPTQVQLLTGDLLVNPPQVTQTSKVPHPSTCTEWHLDALNIYLEITMTMFKKILVPTDGSDTSKKAVATALQLALERKSQVRLIHAIDELAYVSSHEYAGEMVGYAREYGAKILAEGLEFMKSMGVEGDTKLIDFAGARLGDTVADEALSWGADLIVLGTHGRRGIGRFLLGSGAEQVTRLAPVPVLMVRNPEAKDS